MKALVTGATGFVGSHLVEALRRRGDEVTALARSREQGGGPRRRSASAWWRAICTTGRRSSAPMDGQDVVYHVAGVVAARSEADFMAANRDGTRNIVDAAGARGIRTAGVRLLDGRRRVRRIKGRPLRGDEAPRPVTAYGRSKLAAEQAVTASRSPWTIIRPPMVYGPRDQEVLKVFRLARLGVAPVLGRRHPGAVGGARRRSRRGARRGRDLGRHGRPDLLRLPSRSLHRRRHGSRRRPRDGKSPAVIRVPATIGRGVLMITEAAARLTGQTTILTADKANEFFQPAWTGDPSPLTRDTGWQAAHDLRSGLAETYQWYRAAGWL